MKENVLETFSELGFKLEEAENFGYAFTYEGANFLYMPNDNDENFLNISVPGICKYDKTRPDLVNKLADKINSTMKYVKAYSLGDSLWLFYERELFEGEELPPVISNMILHLEASLLFARQCMEEETGKDNGGEEPTDGETVERTEDDGKE